MFTTTLVLVSTVLASQAAPRAPGAAEDIAIAPGASCFSENAPDPSQLADQQTAPVGGTWWVPRFDESGAALFSAGEAIDLIRADDLLIPITITVRSDGSLPIVVPETLAPGDVLGVRAGGRELGGVELRVAGGAPAPAGGLVDEVTVVADGPQTCEVFCRDENLTLPAAPAAALTYSGGPLVVDAWAVFEGEIIDDNVAHRVASYWLDAASEATTVTLKLDELGFDAPLDVRVRALDPVSRDVLHDETLFVGPLGEVAAGDVDGLPVCPQPEPPPFGGCFGTPTPLLALLLPMFALRLRRRRR